MNYDPTTKTCIAKPVDPVNLMDSNALANQSPDVIVGDATGVTKAEIDRNNQGCIKSNGYRQSSNIS